MAEHQDNWIPDLAPLHDAAGRPLREQDAQTLWVKANEYANLTPNKEIKRRAEKIADLVEQLRSELDDPPAPLILLAIAAPWRSLDDIARHARYIGERHAAQVGKGKPAASENERLQEIAAQALRAWRNAGGNGLGVHWDEYQKQDTGPVLRLICTALQMVGVVPPSTSTIKNAVRAADRATGG